MTDRPEILRGLDGILKEEQIKKDPSITSQYTIDAHTPKGVIFPATTEQVSALVKFAMQENLAMVPWGSGTKMGVGHSPNRLDLVVCTSRLNHMKDVDASNLTITVEAGVKFRDIQARLATQEDRCYLPLGDLGEEEDEMICSDRSHSGCFLPLDPPWSEKATIGGIVAANSSGPRRLLYGLPRDIVLGVRFVTPKGEIAGAGGKTVKNVSGYDISKLMIGSMGTLGILCEMTLKLLPLPEKMETLLLSFGSLKDASAFADRLFETPLLPAAVEVINHNAFERVQSDGLPGVEAKDYVVAVALEAFEEAVLRMGSDMVELSSAFGKKGHATYQEDDHLRFWLSMGHFMPAGPGQAPGMIAAKLTYPISEWRSITESTVETLSTQGVEHGMVAHAGSGVCLIGLHMDPADSREKTKAVRAVEALLKRCREAGGNLVIQNAPTELKPDLPIWGEKGQDYNLIQRIREQLDPSRIMSPGRFIGGI